MPGASSATREASARTRKRFLRSARLRGAIDFLTNIPMGTARVNGASPLTSVADGVAGLESDGNLGTSHAATIAHAQAIAAEKALDAGGAIVLRGAPFRHVTSRGHRESRPFRDALLRDGVLDGRVVFARNKEYPSLLFSVLKYDATAESEFRRERQAAAAGLLLAAAAPDETLPPWLRWKGRSYAPLLQPELGGSSRRRGPGGEGAGTSGGDSAGGADGDSWNGATGASMIPGGIAAGSSNAPVFSLRHYRPNGLDDPAIDLERTRFRYSREGYAVSILSFRNERSLKDDINAKFARAHPWLDTGDGQSLTLSKLRSLKRAALNAWWVHGWEVSTVALAIVYFERLVYGRLVAKGNRKLAMAACLLLAYKMNESREAADSSIAGARATTGGGGGDEGSGSGIRERLPAEVVTELEAAFGVTRKALLAAEFPVFVHLRFGLHVPTSATAPHFDRLLSAKGTTTVEYLGPTMNDEYVKALVPTSPVISGIMVTAAAPADDDDELSANSNEMTTNRRVAAGNSTVTGEAPPRGRRRAGGRS